MNYDRAKLPADQAPTAAVTAMTASRVTVLCPYCDREHTHDRHRNKRGRTQRHHHAPPCGLYLTADQRETGYVFTTNPNTY